MRTRTTEQAPAVPAGLLEDLTRSFATHTAEPRQSQLSRIFESLHAMIGSSSFGTAAAALAVLAVASSVVLRPDSPARQDTFRGAGAYSAIDTARVILVGAPLGIQSELEAATDFEDGVFSTVAGTEALTDVKGARVIVDFGSGTITGFNAKGQAVYESDLPESTSCVALKIASALTRL